MKTGAERRDSINPVTCAETSRTSASACGIMSKVYCREAHRMGVEIINLLIKSYFNWHQQSFPVYDEIFKLIYTVTKKMK